MSEVCVPTVCDPPDTPEVGAWTKTGESISAFWSLSCPEGFVLDLFGPPVTTCQKSGMITDLPRCVAAAGCDGSAYDFSLIEFAEGTGDCDADLADSGTCQIMCGEGYQPV